jgi:hypothetical protein
VTSSRDYEGNLEIKFVGPFNGILENDNNFEASQFSFPRYAPGYGFMTNWLYQVGQDPASGYYGERGPGGDKSYFIRTRSVTNEHGELIEALYGKIYGQIRIRGVARQEAPFVIFTYYLNPTPNDRNMEFDPNRNLFRNLSSREQVTRP